MEQLELPLFYNVDKELIKVIEAGRKVGHSRCTTEKKRSKLLRDIKRRYNLNEVSLRLNRQHWFYIIHEPNNFGVD